ncbi:MAG: hypothetical protein PHH77_08980 [Victivallaceae bacterium]|nr:hypothetical protein [Victivallaceae bacterium]
MKNFRFLVMFCILSGLVLGSGCRMFSSPEETPADITLAVLQEKMQRAMDPDRRYRESKSYVQKQMLMVKKDWESEKAYIVEIKFKRPDKLKMVTLQDNAPFNAIIFNGKNAWIVDYRNKQRTLVSGEQLEKMKVLFALGRPDSTYEQVFKQVRITETELDEQPYYKLTCTSRFKDQPPYVVYVGKNNFLTKRIDIPPKVSSTIDQYGLYDGVIIPERTTEVMSGSKKQYELIMYKLDVNIADNEFFPPIFGED